MSFSNTFQLNPTEFEHKVRRLSHGCLKCCPTDFCNMKQRPKAPQIRREFAWKVDDSMNIQIDAENDKQSEQLEKQNPNNSYSFSLPQESSLMSFNSDEFISVF